MTMVPLSAVIALLSQLDLRETVRPPNPPQLAPACPLCLSRGREFCDGRTDQCPGSDQVSHLSRAQLRDQVETLRGELEAIDRELHHLPSFEALPGASRCSRIRTMAGVARRLVQEAEVRQAETEVRQAETERLQRDLADVDRTLGNVAAFDHLSDRCAKIRLAMAMAAATGREQTRVRLLEQAIYNALGHLHSEYFNLTTGTAIKYLETALAPAGTASREAGPQTKDPIA